MAVAWTNRGQTYRGLGQLDKALADCSKAIDLDPKLAIAWCSRGAVYLGLGQLDKALADCSKAIELGPRLAGAWSYRGVVHAKLGQLDKAIADFSKAIQLDPKMAWAWTYRSIALCMQARHAAAARSYAEAFAAVPKLADDPGTGNRYKAARAAALAGCGRGNDAADLDDAERARLRQQALDWLRADLAAWGQLLKKQPEQARAGVQQGLRSWQQEADFAALRGDALAKLPEAERQAWEKFWADVEQTLMRVENQESKPTKPKSPQ
jgi:tetratricopeptide (TPR) repeat protein